jgi:hypothetical protein
VDVESVVEAWPHGCAAVLAEPAQDGGAVGDHHAVGDLGGAADSADVLVALEAAADGHELVVAI